MAGLDTEQFEKDWITTLASTSGIMLTISLMILTILYTASSVSIHGWQKFLIAASIVVASIFLVSCVTQSLNALGTLVNASAHREKGDIAEAERVEDITAKRARGAEWSFRMGLWSLITAIVLSFFFLNWSIFVYIFTK